MATRSARESATKQNDLHRLILTRVLNDPDNKICADCTERMPRWASWSLGIFVCLKCSGVHRSLGVHISKVKSINLDTWTRDQVNHIAARGNKWGNSYYLDRHAKGNNFHIQEGDSNLHQFIRNKYEHKKYMKQGKAPDLIDRSAIMEQCEKEIYGKVTSSTARLQAKAKQQANRVQLGQAVPSASSSSSSGLARPKATNQPNLLDFGDFSAFDAPQNQAQTNPQSIPPAKPKTQPQTQTQTPAQPQSPFDFFASTPASSASQNNNLNGFTADFSQMAVQNKNSNDDPFGMFETPSNPASLTNSTVSSSVKTNPSVSKNPETTPDPTLTSTEQTVTPSSNKQGGNAIADIMALYKAGPSTTSTVQPQTTAISTANLPNLSNLISNNANTNTNNDLNNLFGATASTTAPVAQTSNTNNNDPFAAFSGFSSPAVNMTNSTNPFGDFGASQKKENQQAAMPAFNWD